MCLKSCEEMGASSHPINSKSRYLGQRLLTDFQEIIISLGCGYHRDLQLTKKPFLQGVNLVKETIALLLVTVPEIIVKEDSLKLAMSAHLFATEEVYKLVAEGIPFRQAYQEIKEKFFRAEQETN